MKRTSWPRRKFPNVKGSLQVRPQAGNIIAQKWPRRRPAPRHPTNEYWTEWLKQATNLWKLSPSIFQIAARQAARGTPQMPRDLFIAATRGRLWYLAMPNGDKVFPMCAVRDVSASLDVLGQTKGQILYRGTDLWTPLEPPAAGDLLTFDLATGLPTWKPQAVPALNYTPPAAADFPTIIGSSSPSLAQASTGALVFARGPSGSANNGALALRTLAAATHTYTFALTHAANWQTNGKFGLAIRDSATGRIIFYGVTVFAAGTRPVLGVDYWTSLTAYSSTPYAQTFVFTNSLFFRITRTASQFQFLFSTDDANYVQIVGLAHTAWLATPNQIGFGVFAGNLEGFGSTVAVTHYHDE